MEFEEFKVKWRKRGPLRTLRSPVQRECQSLSSKQSKMGSPQNKDISKS